MVEYKRCFRILQNNKTLKRIEFGKFRVQVLEYYKITKLSNISALND